MNTYEELYHHGIKGMRWGVRRSPEQLGRKERREKRRREKERREHNELRKSTDAKKLYKNRSKLSDKELKNRINRLEMESKLQGYANPRHSSSKGGIRDIAKGKINAWIGGAIGAMAIGLITKAVKSPKLQPGKDALKDAWDYAVKNL